MSVNQIHLQELLQALIGELEVRGVELNVVDQRLGYSEEEAAKLIGLHPRTLFNLRRDGEIEFRKVGTRTIYGHQHLIDFLYKKGGTPHGVSNESGAAQR